MAPKRNGFWYFMSDFKKREESKGNSPGGFAEIQANPQCSKEWNALSEEKKKEYNDRAKKYPGCNKVKMTTLGDPVSVRLEQMKKEQEYVENMKTEISETLNFANKQNSIPDLSFYLIHMNYFYTKTSLDSVVDYCPAEYAIVQFSLADGEKKIHHQIVRTKFELGYTREALEYSDATHKITEDIQQGEADYAVMYKKIIDFLRDGDKKSGKLPAIYTSAKLMKVVPCLFSRLTKAAGVPSDTFDLYSMEYLFGVIMTYCSSNFALNVNPTGIAQTEFEKDSFSYTPNLECAYHKTIPDSSIHCSHSIVRQWIYTICDFCCESLNVIMIPGQHMPEKNDDFVAVKGMSRSSSIASSLQSLSISYKSATGISKGYKPAYHLTPAEERRRREADTPLTIVDHGQLLLKKNSTGPSSSDERAATAEPPKVGPLRPPYSLSQALSGMSLNSATSLDESKFLIGAGRGRFVNDKSKPRPAGRGRGGAGI